MARDETKPRRITEAEALGQAIKRLRRRAEMTQDEASRAADVAVQSWRRYEWGERNLTLDKITRIAEALGATSEELLEEQRRIVGGGGAEVHVPAAIATARAFPPQVTAGSAPAELPIRDRIQAGAWLQAEDLDQSAPRTFPVARDPRFSNAPQWLSEVVGDSMNAVPIFEGDLVHCVDAVAIGYFPKTGDLVEVERLRFGGQERELTLKRVEVTDQGVRLWPQSTNPRWSEPLEFTEGATEEGVEVRIRALVVSSIRRFA